MFVDCIVYWIVPFFRLREGVGSGRFWTIGLENSRREFPEIGPFPDLKVQRKHLPIKPSHIEEVYYTIQTQQVIEPQVV